ncbi:MAG: hypothetical protein AAF805_12655 [Planctomycetota bacterium]
MTRSEIGSRGACAALLTLALAVPLASAQQTLVRDAFEDNAAGWTLASAGVLFGRDSSDALFGFDYSTLGIPEAPNTAPGDRGLTGVRLRTNTEPTSSWRDQAAIRLDAPSLTGGYTVSVDLWQNWATGPDPIGTTNYAGLYVGRSSSQSAAPAQAGAGLLLSGDGSATRAATLYKDNRRLDLVSGQYSVSDFGRGNQPGIFVGDRNTDPANGEPIDWNASFPAIDVAAATSGVQPGTQGAGGTAFQWVTLTATVDADAAGAGPNPADLGVVTYEIANAAGETLLVGTIDNSNPGAAGLDDPVSLVGRVSLVIDDPFFGSSNGPLRQFALFDNLVVTRPIPEPSAAALASLLSIGASIAARRPRR